MDRIGRPAQAARQPLGPSGRIIVDPDKAAARPRKRRMVKQREIVEPKLPDSVGEQELEVRQGGAPAAPVLENIGEPRPVPQG